MAFTSTTYVCLECGVRTRVRGRPYTADARCFTCGTQNERWLSVKWGDEKYAAGKDRGKTLNPNHPKNAKAIAKAAKELPHAP